MFLDDKLYNHLEARSNEAPYSGAITPEDISTLYNELLDISDDYIKGKVRIGMPYSEFSVIVDRTGNLWDSFVKKSLKSEDILVRGIGKLCKEHPFKDVYLQSKEILEIYERGGGKK